MRTVEYAPGRLADVFGEPTQPVILVWHGMQANARAAVGPLAGLLAGHGATVVAADWNSHAPDGGRADLLRSLEFAQKLASETKDADGLVLIGWSLGGAAAAGVTIHATRLNVQLTHTFCLAGAFVAPDPISGRLVTEGLSPDDVGPPFTLLHGLADDVVPADVSREFAAQLEAIGWPVNLVELAADHGSIAGADYDSVADRYEPGRSDDAQRVAGEVAARIGATLRYQ